MLFIAKDAHAMTIVTLEVMSTIVFNVANGTFNKVDPRGQELDPVRNKT